MAWVHWSSEERVDQPAFASWLDEVMGLVVGGYNMRNVISNYSWGRAMKCYSVFCIILVGRAKNVYYTLKINSRKKKGIAISSE